MDNLTHYSRLAETVFILPTDSAMFVQWLETRAKKDKGIGVIPSLKHYHYPHLIPSASEHAVGAKDFGIYRDIFDKGASGGGNWARLPLVYVSIIPLSDRKDYAQCEVWVARLSQKGTIDGQPTEFKLWHIANEEYDRLVRDITMRWPGTQLTTTDHRLSEWDAWNGQLPGEPPAERTTVMPSDQNRQDIAPGPPIRILLLAADPTDASRLRLGEEFREIQEKLQLASLRERFELHQRTSVRPADISQALLDVHPQVVHFCGHGTASGALCFENQLGEIHLIQPEALATLFEQFASDVNCVILNACYSEVWLTPMSRPRIDENKVKRKATTA